ncbi:endolytic transglycosylase MltG [Alteribacillus iranensis]|uniref:Endolytic murein transglycosylase n=1 Tax=Alteribacillus iranensis TaxID=930128 RepID=A0A1I1Z7Z5_9BACI|nr:endolytic transglycosylase MltG [Alteribacillus iranensis]SFE27827.1 UPF0755 protein [Alteribacillus iranensis]
MSENQSNDTFHERARQAKVVRKVVAIIISVLVLVVIVVGVGGYLYIHSALQPVDEESEQTVTVDIPIGSSPASIGELLEEKEIIRNGTIFRYYVTYKNEQGLQAGEYELSPSMEIDEIIQSLKEGKVIQEAELTFTIPEGTWLEGIVETIAESSSYEEEDIMELLNDPSYLEKLIDKYDFINEAILKDDIRYPLEGYIFPARYDYYEENTELPAIIEKMIERMESELKPLSEELEESDLSVHELLTLASIVEREARNEEDRPIIAGVLFNRLEEGMRLEVDPTVAYAIGEHRYMTSYEDLEAESPYNTYRYEGMPPGPIASPGLPSIEAVLTPDDNEYLYFYARPNGEVIYNKEYEDHVEIQEKYRSEWEEGMDN